MRFLYISHGISLPRVAQQLSEQLLAQGYDIWQLDDADDTAHVTLGLAHCAACLVLQAPEAYSDKYQHYEIEQVSALHKTVVPLLLAGPPYPSYHGLMQMSYSPKKALSAELLARLQVIAPTTSDKGHMVEGIRADGTPIRIGSASITNLGKPKELTELAKALRENMRRKPDDNAPSPPKGS